MKSILIVEDEPTISRVLAAYMKKNNYDVFQAFTGAEALQSFASHKPDLVLLDVMLPDLDGWSVLSTIREKSTCPVIMLTALGEVDYRLKGFDTGADDYITKPFVAEEVVARVKAIIRRPQNILEENQLKYGSLHFNLDSNQVFCNGEPLDLTPRDRSLLFFLARHPNQTFSRDQLLNHVWGIDYEGSDRAVDLSIKRIRRTLRPWANDKHSIKTYRGLGYQFSFENKGS
ncbi:response regulator transcription factor [Halobacillus mangrovi]|uniref:DNA-binding response regulator n=1 Tax=Halobacillus mangrovi TaxID=402384 RepID=A0A1W5ZYQ1_9BACI|nr:response regulator transcription factor [Halobacillus mangrovi]ARI78399.1 DNA-binding response regulator [Halobacillus mangrovi]